MEWKHKELIKASCDTIFKKGFKAWITVVAVVFIFTFLGSLMVRQQRWKRLIRRWDSPVFYLPIIQKT